MLIKGIREHITNQLDNEVTVLRKYRGGGFLSIDEEESYRSNPNQKIRKDFEDKNKQKISIGRFPLLKVEISNIPTENSWIFENEFGQQFFSVKMLDDQKKAYESAGNKVEKTIILHRDKKLYFFMVEMKETMSVDNFTKSKNKFESTLAFMSVYLSAHFEFSTFEDSEIYPIGVCCYNYEDRAISIPQETNLGESGSDFKTMYVDESKREFTTKVYPLTLKLYDMPIVFCQNPNNPLTTSFEIDFEEIIQRVESIATATISIPTKTLKDL